jgi:hypothetical protein
VLNVNENSLQLHDGQCRVGIVELDSHLVGELFPGAVGLFEAANDIVQGGSNPKVLLFQPKFFSALQIVVGVQNSADGLSSLLIGNRTLVITIVELLEIKLSTRSFAGPQSQIVCCGCVVPGDGNIVGNSLNDLTTLPNSNGLAILISSLPSMTKELNLISD